ncbi:TldD/PmbA family protein [Salegentibacter mishustinae]|uniref:Peptidase C69 n=1 Tax=Salegentibacter mishustinae TaxID=270918 RepID=A0A0Q9ZJE1_9FLAO|nr:TldD/PmbA family protein [Salegentibacter mishustinae]KRG28983.1 peptidase C69 [Salegentibacter mishustinae]PNW21965.1 peptidase C69 [Salegentibacter mishustinae]PZX65320.1 putative Zn-dependent protease [Salegentibacter mishustinae]UBZ07034.1 TldD/PmbA family protein [Salegentibacter mishustinae]GGW85852.1 TldD protein [Salegentibacter mishustinae]
MAIYTKEEARQIMEKALSFSTADACVINMGGSESGNIRYARNTVTTSGHRSNQTLAVEASFGKKSGTATVDEFDDESLESVVKRAEELAKLAPENPEFMAPLGPQTYDESVSFVESTANISPEYRAEVAAKSINPASEKDVTAAGFLNDSAGFSAMMNSSGLFAYNKSTDVDFTVTMRTNDGTGSGWVTRDYNDVKKFNPEEAAKVAIDKAVMSREARAIEPGKYTVILEPAASVDLLRNMSGAFNARTADEGRSFMSKDDGTKMGEKIVDERVNIWSDPLHPDVPTSTWNGEGMPLKKMKWIENGVVKNLAYSRYWAEQKGVDPVPYPSNFIMEGGDASREELIKSTKRGILVTRLWYIRSVDPQTLLYTGLTRDGTFYIENGEIRYPVKNFRFNESPIIMLNNLETLGEQVRINGNLIPYMKVRDFTFTSLSDAV